MARAVNPVDCSGIEKTTLRCGRSRIFRLRMPPEAAQNGSAAVIDLTTGTVAPTVAAAVGTPAAENIATVSVVAEVDNLPFLVGVGNSVVVAFISVYKDYFILVVKSSRYWQFKVVNVDNVYHFTSVLFNFSKY